MIAQLTPAHRDSPSQPEQGAMPPGVGTNSVGDAEEAGATEVEVRGAGREKGQEHA